MSDLTQSSTVEATLDLDFLRALLPEEPDEAAEFVGSLEEIHVATANTCLENIRVANRNQDSVLLHAAAHSLKGAGLSLGALGMVRVLRQLESARSSAWDMVSGLVSELECETGRVQQALIMFRHQLVAGSAR